MSVASSGSPPSSGGMYGVRAFLKLSKTTVSYSTTWFAGASGFQQVQLALLQVDLQYSARVGSVTLEPSKDQNSAIARVMFASHRSHMVRLCRLDFGAILIHGSLDSVIASSAYVEDDLRCSSEVMSGLKVSVSCFSFILTLKDSRNQVQVLMKEGEGLRSLV